MVTVDPRKLESIISTAKKVAAEYKQLTGRPLGVTGEVAEFEAARLLGLRLADVRQTGFDAIAEDGTRFQVKARVLGTRPHRGQQIGSIKLDREWDAVLFVLLDEEFDAIAIYEADRDSIEAALTLPGSRARNERGALSVSKFKSIARQVWSRDTERMQVEVKSVERNRPTGLPVSRLPDLLASLPRLSEEEACDVARDFDEARAELGRLPAEDRWAS